ncbi:MAG TPA: ABC transporter ATP-binding protein [Devosia sp.]|nr:ABC transporter ATP-binding protein [Devosia sp.]
MTPLIDVRSLRKRFGAVLAVDDLSFSVNRGEVLGFLGPNGAGKSTTMRIIAGFIAPTAGTALVCGEDIQSNPVAAKRRIGYVPEGSPLYGDMTPEGFLKFICDVRQMSREERRKAVATAIDRVQLDEVLHRRIDTLSKGFRRRVGLAQAIIHDPDVLILDEPTDGLDPNQKHLVRELIRSMGDTKAIIVSTHILEEVDAVCDRALIIDRGRVVADGTPMQLHARSPDFNAVSLKVTKAETDRAVKLLRAVPKVASVEAVEQIHGSTRLLVRPQDGEFIAEAVGAALHGAHLATTDMNNVVGTLDDVFRSVTLNQGR